MSLDANRPRATGQDLTVSISPLGLVELADESSKFTGHDSAGTRSTGRVPGHHYSFRREAFEPQHCFNFYRAFTDYQPSRPRRAVRLPKRPKRCAVLLKRVWEVITTRCRFSLRSVPTGPSMEMLRQVAYEEAFEDPSGRVHQAEFASSANQHCFPVPPHDRSRLIRMKIVRFWEPHRRRAASTYRDSDKGPDRVRQRRADL